MGFENPISSNIFRLRSHGETSPAAGNNKAITFPGVARSQLIQVEFDLANDANAANRTIDLWALTDGVLWLAGCEETGVPANATIHYIFWPAHGVPPDLSGRNQLVGYLNESFIYQSLDTLTITVNNIQAGDQLSNIAAIYKQWPA